MLVAVTFAAALGLLALVTPTHAKACKRITESQPNPIADQYPDTTTGTINGTIAILPISYTLARSIIPSQYSILENAYRSLLPDFPPGMYPAMLLQQLDHDVRSGTIKVPDFSVAKIAFPFVDRLGDGYTSMSYGNQLSISKDRPIAIAGASAYGYTVLPGIFDPPCDAYARVNGSTVGEIYSKTYNAKGTSEENLYIASTFAPLISGESSPYTIGFWKNVTNQPQFGNNPAFCDNYIRLFNTSVTLPPFEPTPVKGTVSVVKPLFAKTTTFAQVYGLRLDNAFIENNYVPCNSLQGYSGTGSGD